MVILSSLKVKTNKRTHSTPKVNGFWQVRKRIKLKKKWRFWRSFKFYFLRKKFLSYFSKLKWVFNQNRIIWHYFTSLYGKKIKSLVFSKAYHKVAFGKTFMSIIGFLERRLNVLVLRMRFAAKLLEANGLIANGLILVNGVVKTKNYLVRVDDVIKKNFKQEDSVFIEFSGKHQKARPYPHKNKYRVYKKLKQIKLKKKRFAWKKKGIKKPNVFWFSKTVLSINYLEINYKLWTGILLKLPTFGEVLISKNRKYLAVTMLKKIYFLF